MYNHLKIYPQKYCSASLGRDGTQYWFAETGEPNKKAWDKPRLLVDGDRSARCEHERVTDDYVAATTGCGELPTPDGLGDAVTDRSILEGR